MHHRNGHSVAKFDRIVSKEQYFTHLIRGCPRNGGYLFMNREFLRDG